MPELPEVETIRRQLAPLIQGAVIVGADTHWSSKFTPALDAVGATILNLSRRGKYLLFELDDGNELVAHLGMTGAFQIVAQHVAGSPSCAAHGPHTRAIWALDDGRQLIFRDIRRFARRPRWRLRRHSNPAHDGPRAAQRCLLGPLAARCSSRAVARDQDPVVEPTTGRRGRKHLRRRSALQRAYRSPRSPDRTRAM
jgi:formamidopyrimidine-DNA glycosylase